MFRLSVKNIGPLREVDINDDNNLSVFVGYNEAGKSWLCDAMRLAISGQARGLKGSDLSVITTRGEEDGWSVRLAIDGFNVSRTPTSGDTLKSIAAQLKVPVEIVPIMFSSKMCGDAGSRAMRTFLDSVASVAFDPLQHFTNDAGIRPCIESARRAGKVTTRQTIEFCTTSRAACKAPPSPVMPASTAPSEAQLAAARVNEDAASKALADANTEMVALNEMATGLSAVATYFTAKDHYEKQMLAASVVDELPNRRAYQAVAALTTAGIDGTIVILERIGITPDQSNKLHEAAHVISTAALAAKKTLDQHPAPPSMPIAPVLAKEGESSLASLKAAGMDTSADVRLMLTNAHEQRTALTAQIEKLKGSFEIASKHREGLNRARGAWDSYKVACADFDNNKAKSEAEWRRWDLAAKHIEEAEAAHTAKTGSEFATIVSEFGASILNGRKLTIDREQGIMLNGSSIGVTSSESETWRIEVCVMAAISRLVNSPLLIVDAADILDERNKTAFLEWVIERIVPFFKHTVITSTVQGKLEDQKPFEGIAATKFIIHQGEVQKLVKA